MIAFLCAFVYRHLVTKLLKLEQHSVAPSRLLFPSINTVSFHLDVIMQSLWADILILLTIPQ